MAVTAQRTTGLRSSLFVIAMLVAVFGFQTVAPSAAGQGQPPACDPSVRPGCPLSFGQYAEVPFRDPSQLHIWRLNVPVAGDFSVRVGNAAGYDLDVHVQAPDDTIVAEGVAESSSELEQGVVVHGPSPGEYLIVVDVNLSRREGWPRDERHYTMRVMGSAGIMAVLPLEEGQTRVLGHLDRVVDVAFSPDGRVLATLSDRVSLWRVEDGTPIGEIEVPERQRGTSSIDRLDFSPSGRLLTMQRVHPSRSFFRFWRLEDGALVREVDGYGGAFVADDDTFMVTHRGGTRVLRLSDGAVLAEIPPESRYDMPGLVAAAKDASIVAIWSGSRTEKLDLLKADGGQWQRYARVGQEVRSVSTHELRISPDSRYVALGGGGGLGLWHTADGRLIGSHRNEGPGTPAVAFSPDSQALAFVDYDRAVVWRTSDGTTIGTLKRPAEAGAFDPGAIMVGIDFSPDGALIATGSWDGTARLWRTP